MRAIACITMIAAAAVLLAAGATGGPESVTELHRLYDMTPVSATNPIVAKVADGDIEIPLSELQGYVKTLSPQQLAAIGSKDERTLSAAETRRCLDQLLDEHFLLADGYRHKVDRSDKLKKMLADTQKMLLEETLIQEEVGDRAKSGAEYQALSRQLLDKIFDKATVEISNEAWAELKAAAKRATESKQVNPSAMTLMSEKARNAALMHVEHISVATGDVLDAYLLIPPDKRPDIMTQTGLVALLKAMVGEQMLVVEARARGMDRSPRVVNLLQLNRNILVRMAAINYLTGEAIKQMKAPDIESKLHAWFETNKNRFTAKDAAGVQHAPTYAQIHGAIENRYFDQLSERVRTDYVKQLRAGHRIEYNDTVLAHAEVERPRAMPTTLPSTVVAWDADRQVYKVKEGESTAVFVFRFTNVSTEPVTIYHLEPSCECTNVSAEPLPWKIPAGKSGEMTVAVDVHDKAGTYLRTVEIDSSEGPKTLTMEIHAPEKAKQAAQQSTSASRRGA